MLYRLTRIVPRRCATTYEKLIDGNVVKVRATWWQWRSHEWRIRERVL